MNPLAGLLIFLLDFVAGPIIVAAFLIMMTIAAMKKRGSIAKKAFIILLAYVLFAVIINIYMLYFWNPSPYRNKKADDALSRAIYEATGGKEIYYNKKSIGYDKSISYQYLFYEEQNGQLATMLDAANAALQANTTEKTMIMCFVPLPGGASSVLSVSNYIYTGSENTQVASSTLYSLRIWGTDFVDTIYNDPETYRGLHGIKHLEISSHMATITERDNIDWYEYFPDLETLEIIPKETDN